MKIILTPKEINKIITDFLVDTGKLNTGLVDITWQISSPVSASQIIIEQEETGGRR